MNKIASEKNLHDSPIAAQYMPRSRINEILDKAVCCELVYVIAGAGYGKTQAVQHYLEQRPHAVVRWTQLTESDNTGSRFWEHFTHSISLDNVELAAKARELGFPDTTAYFKQLTTIVKTFEHRSHSTFLVFDDFHLVSSELVLKFIERCVHLRIPGTCVIIISRKEPQINALSLFAKGKACMITEEELRFTDDEIAGFLKQSGITFSLRKLPEISNITKGWALAVQLLTLVLKRIPGNLNLALSTMKQNAFKLIETEAFSNLPLKVQKTMVQFALVSDLPLTSLNELFGDLLFLQNTPQLASFMWFDSFANDYRIHPLYLEFLKNKRHILTQDEKQDTYGQAAQWCFNNDFHMDAVYYFAKLRDFGQILKIFFSHPYRLPQDMSLYYLNILEKLEPNPQERTDPDFLMLKNVFIPLLLAGQGRYEEARTRALAGIEELERIEAPPAYTILYYIYGSLAYIDMYNCVVTHEYNAPQFLKKCAEYYKLISPPPPKLSGPFSCADIRSCACLVGEGASWADFNRFLEAAGQIDLLVSETNLDLYYGYKDLAACELAFFRNQLDAARNHAYRAIAKAHEKKQYSIESMALMYLLRIAMHVGDLSLTKKILEQLRGQLDHADFWNRQLLYDLFTGYFYSQVGLPEMAPSWFIMDDIELTADIHIPNIELFICVKHYMAEKKYEQALAVLCNSASREAHERFLFGELTFSLLTAVSRLKIGDVAGAIIDFERAYKLSFDGEFETPFIELGKDHHLLVAAALKHAGCGIPEQWLKTIDRKASVYAKKINYISSAFIKEKKLEKSIKLSEREQQVLNDLYIGLSREEIAANRYLSINTVKKILQSLYIKLDANNNVDAVRIAIEKKLIKD